MGRTLRVKEKSRDTQVVIPKGQSRKSIVSSLRAWLRHWVWEKQPRGASSWMSKTQVHPGNKWGMVMGYPWCRWAHLWGGRLRELLLKQRVASWLLGTDFVESGRARQRGPGRWTSTDGVLRARPSGLLSVNFFCVFTVSLQLVFFLGTLWTWSQAQRCFYFQGIIDITLYEFQLHNIMSQYLDTGIAKWLPYHV